MDILKKLRNWGGKWIFGIKWEIWNKILEFGENFEIWEFEKNGNLEKNWKYGKKLEIWKKKIGKLEIDNWIIDLP